MILDLADDFFEQIFDGDEAGGAASTHRRRSRCAPGAAAARRATRRPLGLGDEVQGAQDLAQGASGRRRLGKAAEKVLGVDDTRDVVDGVFVDRHT